MNTNPVADLHVHTTASDGVLTVDQLPDAARQAGIEWLAVTDHDRIHPELSEPVTTRDGISIIRGIELRVDAGDQRVDLLGYGVEPTADLVAELNRLQEDRQTRGRRIIDQVESRLDVELPIEPRPGIGRPHIARAIADSEAPYDYDRAFGELIGNDCPCYVPRAVTPVGRGIELLSNACPVVSLAHPFRYPDPEAALDLVDRLDGVEYVYPYGRDVPVDRLDELCNASDLLRTGGSDAHGEAVGQVGLGSESFERFRRRLQGAVS